MNLRYALVLLLILQVHGVTAATTPGIVDETAALQDRIDALEHQNREILKQLAELTATIQQTQTRTTEKSAPKVTETVSSNNVLTEGNKSRLSFYGFARADAIYDDSRPDAAQTPTYIRSEGPGEFNDANFTIHPRLTRLGMNYNGPTIDALGGARLSAKIETDFQNGGRESRAIARYRHAYAQLGWDHSSILIGQTWDIISPLYPSVNADTLMWNAGNLGDRRMQVRYTYQPADNLSLQAGIGLSGAVNSEDLDGNGVRDGEDSGKPHLQGRLAYKSNSLEVGVWGHHGNLKTQLKFNGNNDFDSHSLGIDFYFRPLPAAFVKGEFWSGSGLGDFRGGIGQTINTLTGREIDSTGGWVEVGFNPASMYTLTAGYTVDDPDNGDLAVGARKLNRAWYVTSQLRLAPSFLVGLDYLFWQTDYIGMPEGTDNRLNFYSIYYF